MSLLGALGHCTDLEPAGLVVEREVGHVERAGRREAPPSDENHVSVREDRRPELGAEQVVVQLPCAAKTW